MENLLCVKERIIGKGKPLVCVPIMEKTKESIIKEAKRLVEHQVDMIEWRLDAFEGVQSPNEIRIVLEALRPIVEKTILVYTFRSKNQGGLLALDADEIYDIHQLATESGVVDFVDLEFFEAKKAAKEIKELQSRGVHVIASHHDFAQTPEPQNTKDVLHLLSETNAFHENHPDRALITMSMGAKGAISRVAGEFFGSCVTFGAGEQASAPGQLPMTDLENVLEILHESISR